MFSEFSNCCHHHDNTKSESGINNLFTLRLNKSYDILLLLSHIDLDSLSRFVLPMVWLRSDSVPATQAPKLNFHIIDSIGAVHAILSVLALAVAQFPSMIIMYVLFIHISLTRKNYVTKYLMILND